MIGDRSALIVYCPSGWALRRFSDEALTWALFKGPCIGARVN